MDLTYPQEIEDFRAEVRTWLEENLPEGWFEPGFELRGEERDRFNEEWPRKLFAGGWICASWPARVRRQGTVDPRRRWWSARSSPVPARRCGPTSSATRSSGRPCCSGEPRSRSVSSCRASSVARSSWCQGFSEPDAGSDLASLKTRAELDGDEWVINGQKIWTTQAQHADYIFLLARTDPDAPKHAGISYLLVPMKQPGIETRPIVQIDGSAEFNEVFFTDARCPRRTSSAE